MQHALDRPRTWNSVAVVNVAGRLDHNEPVDRTVAPTLPPRNTSIHMRAGRQPDIALKLPGFVPQRRDTAIAKVIGAQPSVPSGFYPT
jgi:hypothetical protein